MPAGRHRVLDEGKRREICALVSAGCSLEAAAQYVNCSRSTIRREALRNEQFGAELRRSELDAHLHPVRTMQQAAATHWRAAAWLLQRTRPEQYARSAANLVRMETVHDLITRCLELIETELPDTAENEAVFCRLAQVIEDTCNELAAVASSTRDPKRLRRVIARMNTRANSPKDAKTDAPNLLKHDSQISK